MLRSHLVLVLALSCGVAAANAAATNDKRPAVGADPRPRQHYCVRNAESGACEDCWSDSRRSSAGGTCKGLKAATTNPNIRRGSCSQFIKTDFCRTLHDKPIP
jgi:hypothetical protein